MDRLRRTNPNWGVLGIAGLAFLLGMNWARLTTVMPSSSSSSPSPQQQRSSFAPTTILSNQTATEDNAAADWICQAHRAAIRLSPGAPSLTPMIHELLGVNVSEWPFKPVQTLVTRPDGRQAKAAEIAVINAYDARTREAGTWAMMASRHNQGGDDAVVVSMALSLATEVLLVRASRNLYLSKVVPLVESAARKKVTKGRDESEEEEVTPRRQEVRVNELIHWCGEHSRVIL